MHRNYIKPMQSLNAVNAGLLERKKKKVFKYDKLVPTRTFPLFRRIVIAIKEAKPGELIARLTVVGSVGYSANGQSMFPRPIYEQDIFTAVVNRNKSSLQRL